MGEPRPMSGDLGVKGNDAQERPDTELIEHARAGDDAAFGILYERHFEAACRLARLYAPSPADAEDVASEGFAQVLGAIRAGGGPRQAFRPYLLTTVRRIAAGAAAQGKRSTPTPEVETYTSPVSFEDPVLADLEASLVGRAFAALPERWQTVLWHTEVEGENPAQVAPRLGLSANATAALASRAREGLRTEYLQAHLSAGDMERECRKCASKLAAYLRGSLGARDRRHVEGHLAGCRRCSGLLLELREVSGRLRGILGPLVLGPAFLGYVTSHATALSHHSADGTARPNGQHPQNTSRSWPGRTEGTGPRAVGTGVAIAAGLAVLATASSPLPSTSTASEPRAHSRASAVTTAPAPRQSASPRPTPSRPVDSGPVGHPAGPRSNPASAPPPARPSATHVGVTPSARPTHVGVTPSASPTHSANPPTAGPAPLIADGGFDSPAATAPVTLYRKGQHIGAWTVVANSIDVHRSDYEQPADGSQSIDLNGDLPGPTNGAVAQTFATASGGHYVVSFHLAGNVTCQTPTVKTMEVQVGRVKRRFSFDTTGHSPSDMGWRLETVRFTAPGDRTTLRFTSTTDPTSVCGPEIDGVKVTRA